jgi:peptidoglycan/LPS O-acetylase OafA/YrhL
MQTSSSRIAPLQLLRFVAAMMIVLHHTANLLYDRGLRDSRGIAPLNAGVDIFFVLSGFIMVYAFVDGGSRGAFIQRRLFRIVPLYWLLTLFLWSLAAGLPGGLNTIDGSLYALVTSLTFVPQVVGDTIRHPVLSVGWTLIYEMAFYLVFALCMTATAEATARRCMLVLMLVVAAGLVFSPTHPLLQFYSSTMMLEFVAGMGLALFHARAGDVLHRAAPWLLLAGLGLFALQPVFQIFGPRPLGYGVPAFLVVAGTAAIRLPDRFHGLSDRLGDLSYALYLVHPIALAIVARLVIDRRISHDPLLLWILMVSASVLGAMLCWHAFERPVRRRLHRRFLAPSTRRAAA